MYLHSSLSSGLPASNRDRQHTTSFRGTLSVNGSRYEYFRGNNFRSAVKQCFLFYIFVNVEPFANATLCATYYLIYNLLNYCFFGMSFVTFGNGCDCENVMDSNRWNELTMVEVDLLMDLALLLPLGVLNLKFMKMCKVGHYRQKIILQSVQSSIDP